VRTRSISILASSFIALLLGCPLEGMQAPDGSQFSAESDSNGSVVNSESHDDAVDAVEDVSWARQDRLPSGSSALRVLMTDAPVEADSVFVTFCGIFVESAGAPAGVDGRDDGAPGPRGEAGAGAGDGRGGGAAGAPAETARGGAGGAGGAGSAGEAPADGASDDAAQTDADQAEAEQQAAEDAADEVAPSEPEGQAGEGEAADPEEVAPETADGRPANDRGDGGDAVDPRAGDVPRGAWQSVNEGCQTLDLLTLRDGVTEAVGVATLPPGRYGQIRLMLVDASIVVDGVEHELTIPSGAESGLKINGGFALYDGAATTITLDFDAGRSVHYTEGSGYIMRPVIDVIDVTSHAGTAEDGEKRDPAAAPETRDPRDNPEPRMGDRPREGGAAGAGAGGAGSGGAGAEPSHPEEPRAGDRPPRREPPPGEPPPGEEPSGEPPPPADEPEAE
jgi:hypothetical protein